MVQGEAGTTTLAENVEAYAPGRYRVEKYLIADPADVDGDCTDDITELANLATMSPVNAAAAVDPVDGTVSVQDLDAFLALSHTHSSATHKRAGSSIVKFLVTNLGTDRPGLYFNNFNTSNYDLALFDSLGGAGSIDRFGVVTYDPELAAPDGSAGAYYADFGLGILPSFSEVERLYTLLAANLAQVDDNLYIHIQTDLLQDMRAEQPLYQASRIDIVVDQDVFADVDFVSMNPGVGFGRLQKLDPDERPLPHDIVIYEALPNDLPRVAGIITTVHQTPLSHVNLRSIQNDLPNAYIRDATDNTDISELVGDYVRYEVTGDEWKLRAATNAEADAHYEALRPATTQTPERDLSVTTITALTDVSFDDWDVFGVKAANVAELGTLGFAEGTVPDGFAIPFYFYDEFMKANGLYSEINTMLADTDFQTDFDVQDEMLDDLRDDIKDATTPQWIIDALTAMHDTFLEDTKLRYRSSTNNEDLPGFNGAGLYDSNTQKPSETEDDGIDKSLKQVYASMWNFRAFTEREFHRIDHSAAAMGVLVHPNYSAEFANGVAVSFNPYGDSPTYYVNTQLGEDLITNPEAYSTPEELLVFYDTGHYVVRRTSSLVPRGRLLMSDAQIVQLAQHLSDIHDHFEALYDPEEDEPFAMEIEFKITEDDILAIKQARPWVY